jgi:holo-[acyl-carrier protein] synthase
MTVNQDTFVEDIEKLYQINREQLTNNFNLNHGQAAGSLGRAKLDSILRKHGFIHPAVYQIKTYGELKNLVLNEPIIPQSVAETKPVVAHGTHTGSIGVDIEKVARFPHVTDYWENIFYKDHFSPREISYCIKQDNPAEHFAGRWCAKEALIKCFAHLQTVSFNNIEIIAGADKKLRAYLLDNNTVQVLPAKLSISHSEDYAIAVAIFHEQNQQVTNISPESIPVAPIAKNKLWEKIKNWLTIIIISTLVSLVLTHPNIIYLVCRNVVFAFIN